MPSVVRFNISAIASCQITGGQITVKLITDLSEPIQYSIEGVNTGTISSATSVDNTYIFSGLPNDIYEVAARPFETPNIQDSTQAVVNCAGNDVEPPVNDLVVTATATPPSEPGLMDGKVNLSVSTSHLPFKTKLNTGFFEVGKLEYTGMLAGTYTFVVMDEAGFTKETTVTIAEPEAPPLAPNMYYAVGGTLPNPIQFDLYFDPLYLGAQKVNHYVEVEILSGEAVIGSTKQRVRDGKTSVNISEFLKRAISLNNSSQVITPEDVLLPFTYRYRENFNNTPGNWKVDKQPRFAVQAALQAYSSDFNNFVVRGSYDPNTPEEDQYYKFLTSFDIPVKFACHGMFLSTIIDTSLAGTPLYFKQTFYAADDSIVEIRSELIPETDYGKLIRLQITDDVLPCAHYIDAVITDVIEEMAGLCEPNMPPPSGFKIFGREFDLTFE